MPWGARCFARTVSRHSQILNLSRPSQGVGRTILQVSAPVRAPMTASRITAGRTPPWAVVPHRVEQERRPSMWSKPDHMDTAGSLMSGLPVTRASISKNMYLRARALFCRSVSERVAHPVKATVIMRRIDQSPGSSPQPLVIVGNDQLHTAQTTICESPKEVRSEGLRFRGPGGDAETLTLAIFVDRDGDYRGADDDPSALTHLRVGRVEPETGPGPSGGRARSAFTRPSISTRRRLTWLFDLPQTPVVFARSSTVRM